MLSKLFDSNERQLKKYRAIKDKVNEIWPSFADLSQEDMVAKTNEWKEALRNIETPDGQEKYMEKILPEAFALVKEATKRTQDRILHDTQIIAGAVLHDGKISEQKTGEGKTNTATLPGYLNALTGKGVHIVTPNDYLSRHGAGWMGVVYTYLGLGVGVVMQERAFVYDSEYEGDEFNDEYAIHLKETTRKETYAQDIVYGTNHEFGFDYLRDNMAYTLDNVVQNNAVGEYGVHNFAIVDEVDSILIDMARTPLIISTTASVPTERYHESSRIVNSLIKGTDFEVEEKFRNATLTDLGVRKVEKMLGTANLYEEDFEMVHLIEQALMARALYEKDRDYIVKDGRIIIVDQFTGRLLPNNTFSHGLHQAIEAKEGVAIREETRSVAEISYQNYFRMYRKLAGMTGTAVTEAEEFYKIYNLDVIAIPTHRPVARTDHNDVVYKTEAAKFRAVANEIVEKNKLGQPVLVGTTSVDKSQLLHDLLSRRGVSHEILNAKNHEQEAKIIADAGKKGAVTVSTNMAGRGVDIILGGEHGTEDDYKEVVELGGLHVVGTERHDSRRIDNQLRGRSGRQGDPGSSRFYLSLQDDLMRVFGGAQVEKLMERFNMDENIPLEAGIVSKAVESAQKKVEGFNFDRRKQVVEMDDVINVHRDVVYKIRRKILFGPTEGEEFKHWFIEKLEENTDFDVEAEWEPLEKELGLDTWLNFVSQLSLPVVNLIWMEHLVDMDQLREGIGLRGYAQRDPMVEYKKEGHAKFELLVTKIYSTIADRISNVSAERLKDAGVKTDDSTQNLAYQRASLDSGVADEAQMASRGGQRRAGQQGGIKVEPVKSSKNKVGRNDPCPCGSGLKYKKCGMINSPKHKG